MPNIHGRRYEEQNNVEDREPSEGHGIITPIHIDDVPGLSDQCEPGGRHGVGSDIIGDHGGDVIKERQGKVICKRLVPHFLLPIRKGTLLRQL